MLVKRGTRRQVLMSYLHNDNRTEAVEQGPVALSWQGGHRQEDNIPTQTESSIILS